MLVLLFEQVPPEQIDNAMRGSIQLVTLMDIVEKTTGLDHMLNAFPSTY